LPILLYLEKTFFSEEKIKTLQPRTIWNGLISFSEVCYLPNPGSDQFLPEIKVAENRRK
jgi:hypothetical protein